MGEQSANGPDGEAQTSSREYALVNLYEVKSRAVDWVEKPYLARGELHVIQGLGGSYKGTMAYTWAAEFSLRGEHCLLLTAEDALDTKVKPTLELAGGDMQFIHPFIIRSGENTDALILPDDLAQLERGINDTGATFVVIDPILTHVSMQYNSYRDQDMKRVLSPLSQLAQRTNTVILCVHHVRKDTSGGLKVAGQASTAFTTTARIVMHMHKVEEGEAILEVIKSNIGPEGAGQKILAAVVKLPCGAEAVRITRDGQSDVSIEEIISDERKGERSKTNSAMAAVLEKLAHGEMESKALSKEIATEYGLSYGSVQNAKTKLKEKGLIAFTPVRNEAGTKVEKWLVSRTDSPIPDELNGN